MRKKKQIDLIQYGSEVLVMDNNRITLAFVYETKITFYRDHEKPFIEYLLFWNDEDGDERKETFSESKVFETREALLASL